MMYETILKYSFLGIFLLTAIIGIGSLPDWIKIQEWYKKKIFIALILEVVGAIIILFNNLNTPKVDNYTGLNIRNINWVAVNENAQFISPEIAIKDSMYEGRLLESSFSQFKNLRPALEKRMLLIKNIDNKTIGEIPEESLEELGFFNEIESDKSDISSSKNYSYISWEKDKNDEWVPLGESGTPFELEVYDENNKTKYNIVDTLTKEVMFNSDNKSEYLFNVNNRINHFYSHNNKYYLIRIAFADLSNKKKKYVRVIYLRLNPILNINKPEL